MPFDFVYITAASPDQARAMGRILVTERLAACANVFDNMSSCYWWEGKVGEAREAVLIAKTRSDLVPAVISRVKALHSYSVPCVVALRVDKGNPDFLRWIARETVPKTRPGGAGRKTGGRKGPPRGRAQRQKSGARKKSGKRK